jgi:hypothetical protein
MSILSATIIALNTVLNQPNTQFTPHQLYLNKGIVLGKDVQHKVDSGVSETSEYSFIKS